MTWLPPFVVYGTHALDDAAIEAQAGEYREFVQALRDDAVDAQAAMALDRINPADLDLRPYPRGR